MALLSVLAVTVLGFSAQAGQGPQPSICTRSCWGARNSSCSSTMSSLVRAIVHHTAGTGDWTTDYEAGKAKVRGVQNGHMDANGWCDIGYHFLINAGGHIYEGRKNSMTGLPKGSHDCANGNSFGFTVLGYYHPPHNQTFTTASRNSLEAVIAWRMPSSWSPYGSGSYCQAGGACGTACKTVGFLDGHKAIYATDCPGNIIIAQLQTIRDGVNNKKNPPPPPPSVKPALAFSPVGRSADGRLEVFSVGTDNRVYKVCQSTPGGTWSWYDHGGGVKPLGVTVAANLNGCLEIFAVGTDNAVWHMWQVAPNSTWSSWTSLGGSVKSGVGVISINDGRLEIFAVASDNAVWHNWQVTPSGAWNGWVSMGGSVRAEIPGLAMNADGRLQVFANDLSGTPYTKWQTSLSTGAWSGWESMGGSGGNKSPLIAARNPGTGIIDLFVVGSDNTLSHNWQTAPNSVWNGWMSRGGSCQTGQTPGVSFNANEQMQVFVNNVAGNAPFTIWQTSPGGTWSSWEGMGGGGNNKSRIVAGQNLDARMEIFTIGGDNGLYHSWQNSPNSTWSGWAGFGGSILGL